MIDAYQELVVRELSLNSPNALRGLKTCAFAVGRNIVHDPRQKSPRTIPLAELPDFNGLSSFLKKIIGFKFERDHGDRLDTVLYLPLVERNEALLLETVRTGLDWLDAKVRITLLPMAESSRCHPDSPIAEVGDKEEGVEGVKRARAPRRRRHKLTDRAAFKRRHKAGRETKR